MTPIEIRPNRFLYLIPIVIALGLMFLFVYFTFVNPEGNEMPTMMYVMSGFMVLVGSFLSVKLFQRFLRNEFVFRMDDEGIESNEGGITTGLIRWSEIKEAREIKVPSSNRRSMATETVLALYLHHPEKQRARYNPALQALTNFAGELMGSSVLITPAVLGNQYNRALELIRARVPLSAGPAMPFEESESTSTPVPAQEQTDPVVRYFKYLYEYRMGRQKADARVYGFYALIIACVALGFLLPGLPVQPIFIFMGLFAVLFVYALVKMNRKAADH
ncbi:STM3941 family protein [Flaviaesturariibacter amylovorans]|uniref:Uncharacterized protein n=1 Tax=Flaviaesturariibacter amylovorans TaxID=1084520 RepID=A0ABP8GAT0_9BACT